MFWNREKPEEGIKNAIKDASSIHANNTGATRRATGMMPVASSEHEIAHTGSLRFHELIVSLEGNQRTGCLRIISPKRKSRSAILIYRGRVMGCLYGSRKLDWHFMQQEAHREALADLAAPGNILDAYELPEELVLASSSMFSGQMLELDLNQQADGMMDQALRSIAETRLPGCVVVSTMDDEMVSMVYMFDGKIIGVFSAQSGWVKPSYEAAMQHVFSAKPTKVLASYLTVADREQAETLGFSLTGLADLLYRPQSVTKRQMQAAETYNVSKEEVQTYTKMEAVVPKPKKNEKVKPRFNHDMISTVRSHNVFAICP